MNRGARLVPGLLLVAAASLLAVSTWGQGQVPISSWTASASTGVPEAALSQFAVAPGKELSLTASGFAPGSKVAVALGPKGVSLGNRAAGPNGDVSATVRVPAGTVAGAYVIELAGSAAGGTPLSDQLALRVT
jgi:hypothetical protein